MVKEFNDEQEYLLVQYPLAASIWAAFAAAALPETLNEYGRYEAIREAAYVADELYGELMDRLRGE